MELVSIDKVIDETLSIIERRAAGEKFGYATGWSTLNRAMGGGISYNTNLTIGGRTGTGKSAFCNLLLLGILNNNPTEDFVVLYWNWEMMNYQQGLRLLSNQNNKSVSQLMSAETTITKSEITSLKKSVEQLKGFPVHFIESPDNPKNLAGLIGYLADKRFPGKNLINFFDHTRLVLQDDITSEEVKIHKFYECLQTVKKKCRCTNIVLSQLNRKLEDDYNKSGRYRPPNLSDIFGSDAAAQYSESVILLHRPELYNQLSIDPPIIIGEHTYNISAKDIIVAELAKNRDGPIGRIVFKHNLKYNQITEWKPPHLQNNQSQNSQPVKESPKSADYSLWDLLA
jgi:replicative DNA helicase